MPAFPLATRIQECSWTSYVSMRWIAAGAKVETEEPETLAAGFVIRDEDRKWWAFRPITRPVLPKLKEQVSNPIDAFLLQRLAEKGLGFNPPADRVTLIRRVTLDLTGLPPTPDAIDDFVKDKSAEAYEKVVDRLLNSPRFLHMVPFSPQAGRTPEHYRDLLTEIICDVKELEQRSASNFGWKGGGFDNSGSFVMANLRYLLETRDVDLSSYGTSFESSHVLTSASGREGRLIVKELYALDDELGRRAEADSTSST